MLPSLQCRQRVADRSGESSADGCTHSPSDTALNRRSQPPLGASFAVPLVLPSVANDGQVAILVAAES